MSGRILLIVSRSSSVTVTQEARAVRLAPGEMALVDTTRMHQIGGGESVAIAIASHEVPWPSETLAALTANRLDNTRLATRMVEALVSGVADPADSRDADVRDVLLAKAMRLLIDDALGAAAARGELSTRERLRYEVITYIDDHLGDADLDVARIARAHHLSSRSLHTAFAGGDSVAALIRRMRIERCKRQLVNPVFARRPVAAIGAAWGLPDPHHFGRVFRSMVGAPPSAYRAAALADRRVSRDFTKALPGRATWSVRPLPTVDTIANPDRRRPPWLT